MSVEIRRIRQAIRRRVLPSTPLIRTKIQGRDMILDMRDHSCRMMWKYGVYEPETTLYVQQHVSKGQLCLDIGANVGYYTLMLSKLVGERGQVHAFEPNPYIFKILERNAAQCANVSLYKSAVYSRQSVTSLFLTDEHGHSGLYSHSGKSVSVETIDIDSLELSHIDLAKIDVEGAECEVIQGMEKTLARSPSPVLIVEFEPMHTGFDGEKLFRLTRGFKARMMGDNILFFREET